MQRWRTLLSIFLTAATLISHAGEKPTLEHLFPAAASRGTTNDIAVFGKFEPWPPKGWASVPGLDFQFSTNKGKSQLTVATNAPVGPCLVRFYNDDGPSDLRVFVVTDTPEINEQEPNNHFARAQLITNCPVTVNGRLEKNGDVDCFRLHLQAGQWLDASVDSYTLMAKLDPVLRLMTTNGYQLAWNHDFASLDPRLVWQAPNDTNVVVQLFGFAYPADSDIRLSGGPAGVYRLHVAVSGEKPIDLRPVPTEREPNDDTNNPPALDVPAEVVGTINPGRDIDRFSFNAKRGDDLELKVKARAIGSPLDAWLAIENTSGKELARNDDSANSPDPTLEWKAPEDGSYRIAIGSTTHQGGDDYRYLLNVRPLAPEYFATSLADSVILTAGATNVLKLNFKRLRGFTNELTATCENLPLGVSAAPLVLAAKDGEVSLTLLASTNAVPTNTTIRVLFSGITGQRSVPFELVSRTENNGVPGGYSRLLVERIDQLWLTVKLAAKVEPAPK